MGASRPNSSYKVILNFSMLTGPKYSLKSAECPETIIPRSGSYLKIANTLLIVNVELFVNTGRIVSL